MPSRPRTDRPTLEHKRPRARCRGRDPDKIETEGVRDGSTFSLPSRCDPCARPPRLRSLLQLRMYECAVHLRTRLALFELPYGIMQNGLQPTATVRRYLRTVRVPRTPNIERSPGSRVPVTLGPPTRARDSRVAAFNLQHLITTISVVLVSRRYDTMRCAWYGVGLWLQYVVFVVLAFSKPRLALPYPALTDSVLRFANRSHLHTYIRTTFANRSLQAHWSGRYGVQT